MLIEIILTGIIATALLDAWAVFYQVVAGQAATNWGLVGRWIAGIPKGLFIQHGIANAKTVANEKTIGWSAHYIIGIIYAWLYLLMAREIFASQPGITSALGFGLATVIAPWFILQPGMGLGVCARKTPKPWLKRLSSILAHSVFGIGLFLGWWLYQLVITGSE